LARDANDRLKGGHILADLSRAGRPTVKTLELQP
jgi:hypothetical protein